MSENSYVPSIEDLLFFIGEQLRISNLIALKRAWRPTRIEKDEDAKEFYLVGNRIDEQIAQFLQIEEIGDQDD